MKILVTGAAGFIGSRRKPHLVGAAAPSGAAGTPAG
jgi:nucleoside-diphosphate-sugar epimerase